MNVKINIKEYNLPQMFIVTRDGFVDEEYIEALERAERVQAMKDIGLNALKATAAYMKALAVILFFTYEKVYNDLNDIEEDLSS
jgi:hypothetical protein